MFNYGYMPQMERPQPIQNIINTQMPNAMFMAQMVKQNERVEDIFVNNRTAFIDLYNKQLKIKEIDGTIMTYGLILPKDEKDIQIENLQKQIEDLKGLIRNEQSNSNATTDYEITQ